MDIIRTGIVFALLIVGCRACCQNGTDTLKYDLLECLLDKDKYSASMSPNYNSDHPLKVSVQIAMYDIGDMEDYTMTYKSTLYIRLKWTDPRLDFESCGTYESLTVSGADFQKCWTPDLFFHHERDASVHSVTRTNEVVYIGKNGTVTFSARLTLQSHCSLDLTNYPFDKQTCNIIVQSYASKADEMILEWNKDSAFQVQNSKVFSITDDSLSSSFQSPITEPFGNYSTLKAKLGFKRISMSYEVMYICPPIFLFLIAYSSFLLLDCGDLGNQTTVSSRISLCTGALTSTVMLWAGIYAKLPPVPVLLVLDGWMFAHVFFIATVLFTHSVLYVCGTSYLMTATLADCFAHKKGAFGKSVEVKVIKRETVQDHKTTVGKPWKSLNVTVSDGIDVAKVIIYDHTKFPRFTIGSTVKLLNIICKEDKTLIVTWNSRMFLTSQLDIPQDILNDGKILLIDLDPHPEQLSVNRNVLDAEKVPSADLNLQPVQAEQNILHKEGMQMINMESQPEQPSICQDVLDKEKDLSADSNQPKKQDDQFQNEMFSPFTLSRALLNVVPGEQGMPKEASRWRFYKTWTWKIKFRVVCIFLIMIAYICACIVFHCTWK